MAADKIEDARLAETVERYEDMAKFMKEYVENKEGEKGLDADQRNLLSVAYKNVVGSRRSAWRVLSSMEEKAKDNKQTLVEYKSVIEEELQKICNEVISLLDDHLIQSSPSKENISACEAQIFFLKMKGDYFRYLCEVADSDKRKEPLESASDAYQKAFDLAVDVLEPTHPIRLGLALNFSVFYYEIKGSPDRACEVAKKAFDDAIAKLDSLPEDSHKDSTLIMQLLRDNLTLWTSDTADGDEDGGAN